MVLDQLQQRLTQHWLRFQLKSALTKGSPGEWQAARDMLRENRDVARLLIEAPELAQQYGPYVLDTAMSAHPEAGLWVLKHPDLRTLRVPRLQSRLAHEAVQHHLAPARYALEHPEIREIQDDKGMTVAAYAIIHHAVLTLGALEDPGMKNVIARSIPHKTTSLPEMARRSIAPHDLVDEMEELDWPPARRQKGLLVLAQESPQDFIVFVRAAHWLKDMPKDFFPPLLKAASPEARQVLLRQITHLPDGVPSPQQKEVERDHSSSGNSRQR